MKLLQNVVKIECSNIISQYASTNHVCAVKTEYNQNHSYYSVVSDDWFVVWQPGWNSICGKLHDSMHDCMCVVCAYNDLFSTYPISLSPHRKIKNRVDMKSVGRHGCLNTYSFSKRSHKCVHCTIYISVHVGESNSFCIVSISISFIKTISMHHFELQYKRRKIRRKCASFMPVLFALS